MASANERFPSFSVCICFSPKAESVPSRHRIIPSLWPGGAPLSPGRSVFQAFAASTLPALMPKGYGTKRGYVSKLGSSGTKGGYKPKRAPWSWSQSIRYVCLERSFIVCIQRPRGTRPRTIPLPYSLGNPSSFAGLLKARMNNPSALSSIFISRNMPASLISCSDSGKHSCQSLSR